MATPVAGEGLGRCGGRGMYDLTSPASSWHPGSSPASKCFLSEDQSCPASEDCPQQCGHALRVAAAQ